MPRPNTIASATLAALLVCLPAAQAAEKKTDAAISLKRVESELADRKREQQELNKKVDSVRRAQAQAKRRLIEMARQIQRREEHLNAAETRLAKLAAEETSITRRFQSRQQALSRVLGALSRLERSNSRVMLVGPGNALQNMRGSLMLASVAPALEERARDLRAELEELRRLRADIVKERDVVARTRHEMTGKRAELRRLLKKTTSERQALLARADGESKRISKLTASAKDLRELMARLDRDRSSAQREAKLQSRIDELKRSGPTSSEAKSFAKAAQPGLQAGKSKGILPLPARGRIVENFGKSNAYGIVNKGIRLETRPQAQVITPFDGEVVYAGPFRGYGLLLIIAHGEGYHTLLAGFSRIHVVVGQILLANEPVGEMGGGDDGESPKLYVEMRHRGEAFNPLTWLTANNGKVKG